MAHKPAALSIIPRTPMVVIALSGGMALYARSAHLGPADPRQMPAGSPVAVSEADASVRRTTGSWRKCDDIGCPYIDRSMLTLLCLCGSVRDFDVIAGSRRPREHVARERRYRATLCPTPKSQTAMAPHCCGRAYGGRWSQPAPLIAIRGRVHARQPVCALATELAQRLTRIRG